jgi:hypothetical protein
MLVASHRCSLRVPSRHDSPARPAGWVAVRRRGRSRAHGSSLVASHSVLRDAVARR